MDILVRHAFVARGDGELSVAESERLLLVEETSSEWCKVRNRDGKSGWIPSTYLEKCVPDIDGRNHDKTDICVAIHRYTATHADEISFKVGDAIEILQKKDDGWWKGRVQGLDWTGWFPANLVEPKKRPRRKKRLSREESTTSRSSSRSFSSDAVTDSETETHFMTEGSKSHSTRDSSTEQRLRALYHYTATSDDELSFSENEILYLLKGDDTNLMEQQGWWQVMDSKGRIGLIPANYVEYDKLEVERVSFKAVAIHTYTSEGSEELSFVEGQVLEVIHSETEWWFARDGETGTSGYIPSNYVRPLDDSNTSKESTDSGTPGMEKNDKVPSLGSARSSKQPAHRVNCNHLRNSRRIPMGPFYQKDWYFGPMSRKECESLFERYCPEDGVFLVRDGGKHALDFVLSVKSLDRVRHFRVTMNEGTFSLVPAMKLKSMDDLLHNYKKAHLFTEANGQKLLLKNVLYSES